MDTRQLITGLFLALGVFLLYQFIINKIYPPRELPPPATQPVAVETAPATRPAAPATAEVQPPVSVPTTAPRELAFVAGPGREPVTIGGRSEDALELTLTPRGAAVESIRLTARKDHRYVYRAEADSDEPYEVVQPVAEGVPSVSFATDRIVIKEYGNRTWPLHDLVWTVAESSERHVLFTTVLRAVDADEELLRLTKTYDLQPGKPLVDLSLTVENASERPLTVSVVQNGAVGISRESPMYEMRRLIAAQRDGGTVTAAKVVQRGELHKKAATDEPALTLFSPGETTFAWTALANRFFGVFVRPLAAEDAPADFVQYVDGVLALPEVDKKLGDLVARMATGQLALPPREKLHCAYEIYVGPKDSDILESVNPDFVDETKVYYTLAQAADRRCCTFEPLPQIMLGLLHGIHYVVRNFGVAIIILVVIVRTLLHPLTVYQQKNMFRMQESMARLKPKMDVIKERYANDKTRQNQEMMKLYAEEGVNPMGTMVSMLPLLIQMPILVALWTGLNTDILLRHAPFDGWWIDDLAAPDALVTFANPITLPILGWLPLVGWMFQDIPSLNLLPILMGVSMWLQQKYMPKPGAQAKLEAAKQKAQAQRKAGQMTPEDQLRQQQMMGYMMTFMFPLMFYYMPSGLNLYWGATTVFGIGESLIIRKQLREEKERRAREGARPAPKKSGIMGRVLKKMAKQAEELQKKADALSDQDRGKPRTDRGKGKGRKKP